MFLTMVVAGCWAAMIVPPLAATVKSQLPSLWAGRRVRLPNGKVIGGDEYIELVRLERAVDGIVTVQESQ